MNFRPLRLRFFPVLLCAVLTQAVHAQTWKIMPLGSSITLGKVNNARPIAPDEGYRSRLHAKLDAAGGFTFGFVGDSSATDVNKGIFADTAKIADFSGGILGNITTKINSFLPNIVILEIGTYDIGKNRPIGTYTTNNTIMKDYYTLVNAIVTNTNVTNLLLCKIIPKLSTPGEYQETLAFNNAIDIMLAESGLSGNAKIVNVDMFTPFDAKQNLYYSLDKINPNGTGYDQMAEIFYRHLMKIIQPNFSDQFSSPGPVPGNGWVAGANIVTNGNSMFINSAGTDWGNLAVWTTSKGFSTVSMKFHASAGTDLTGVGLAMALDNNTTNANGYMVFVYGGSVRAFTIVNGAANTQVDSKPMGPLVAGDVVKVSFIQGSTSNVFSVSVNNGTPVSLVDSQKRQGNGADLYSGILFKGTTGPYTQFVDWFQVDSQLPDAVAPGAPYNFGNITKSNTSVLLSWNAPGSDGYGGEAASRYDLRYSTKTITETNFKYANIVSGLGLPKGSGSAEQFSVTGLIPGTQYYFRLRAIDSWGNIGELSDEFSVTTNATGIMVDNFNRSTLGPDWVAPVEYTIDTTNHTLVNSKLTGDWTTAIYTGRTDPLVVKMVWDKSTNVDNVGDAGLAVMLTTKDTATTSGFFVFVHKVGGSPFVSLYNIENGTTAGSYIEEVPYTKAQFPRPGDTLSVAINWTDATNNIFDVFINDTSACRSLYDPLKRHRVEPMYSGLMLKPDNKNCSISRFSTISEFVKPGPIEFFAGPTTGTVGATLSSPLQILYSDANNTPLPGMPVWFWVNSPDDATLDTPPPPYDPIQIEAEWDKNPVGTYVSFSDPTASGGKYMMAEAGTGSLSLIFYVPKDSTYYIYGRTVTDAAQHMAIEVQMDDLTSWVWNANNPSFSTAWQWDAVNHQNDPPASVHLTRGTHTLKIIKAHDRIKIDKFMLTPNSNPRYSGMQYTEPRVTDQIGVAGTFLTLGKKTGVNTITAWAFGTTDSLQISVTGTAAAPVTMTKSNDNQSGAAKDTLAKAFVVTLKDQYQNLVPDIPVRFAINKGVLDGGTLIDTVGTTNANGQASVKLIFGRGSIDSVYTVVASLDSSVYPNVQKVTFTGSITSGRAKRIDVLSNAKFDSTLNSGLKYIPYVGDSLFQWLKVKVSDELSHPLDSATVIFKVTTGNAVVDTMVYTDTLGIARSTIRFGSTASIVTVTARSSSIQKTVVSDSVFYRAVRINRLGSSLSQRVDIGDTTALAFKVQITDKDTVNLPNHPVTFVIKNRNGSNFKFLNGLTTLDTLSVAPSGVASAYVIADSIHGYYENILEVNSSDGFTPNINSPIRFSLYVVSNAKALKVIKGNNQKDVIHAQLDTLIVQMVDLNDQPVKKQPIEFRRLSETGLFEDTQNKIHQVFTDSAGMAKVIYSLGDIAGNNTDTVIVTATNGQNPLTNSPISFIFSAKSTGAATIAAYQDTSTSAIHLRTGVAGKPIPIQVQIKDDFGNPVEVNSELKQFATFWITHGNGGLNGTRETVALDSVKNASGIAAVNWTLGTKAGIGTDSLIVTAQVRTDSLSGSPVKFVANVVADSVSPDSSFITTKTTAFRGNVNKTQFYANGNDTCMIWVTLRDRWGNPVAGKRVSLNVASTTQNFYTREIGPTDALGKASGFLLSTASGEKIIQAVSDLTDTLALNIQNTITHMSNTATDIDFATPSHFSGNIGTILADSLGIYITDVNRNKVKDSPATFKVIHGGGWIVGTPMNSKQSITKTTDSTGCAWVRMVLGTDTSTTTIQVTGLNSSGHELNGSPLEFSITGIDAKPVSMKAIPGAAMIQDARAGEELTKPFMVGVVDLSGNPVYNAPVNFAVESGDVSLVYSQARTDVNGLAKVWARVGGRIGMSKIKAYNDSLTNSPIRFTVNTQAGPASNLKYVFGNGQTGLVGQPLPYPLTVKTVDAFNNPVSNIPIQFSVVGNGNATIEGLRVMTYATNDSGAASAIVTMGQAGEPVRVEATNDSLGGSPVIFNITFNPFTPDSIYKAGGDDQNVTINQPLVDPIQVLVVDRNNIPVPDVSVLFTLDSGGGELISADNGKTGNQLASSDSRGIAKIQYRAGANIGKVTVKAHWLNQILTFNLEAVQNNHFPELVNTLDSAYTYSEGRDMVLIVGAVDLDNNPLIFQVFQIDSTLGNLPAPEGVSINPQQPDFRTARFQWFIGDHQAGDYKIVFRVLDGRGGFDADTVRVKIVHSNHEPSIDYLYSIPTTDSTVVNGSMVRFFVKATDPDPDDVLHYQWKVGNVIQRSDAPVLEYWINELFTGRDTVKVIVTDNWGLSARRPETWVITVQTAVEMTSFAAVFNPDTRKVEVEWETSREVGNLGFDVYRSESENGEFVKVNPEFLSSQESGLYHFEDDSVKVGRTYFYQVKDLNGEGGRKVYGPLFASIPVPKRFEMSRNYPNPFNPETVIRYSLPRSERVALSIFNLMGQEVARLVDQIQEPGYYTVTWNGRDQNGREASTGIYLYRLQGDKEVITLRMVKMQ